MLKFSKLYCQLENYVLDVSVSFCDVYCLVKVGYNTTKVVRYDRIESCSKWSFAIENFVRYNRVLLYFFELSNTRQRWLFLHCIFFEKHFCQKYFVLFCFKQPKKILERC